MALGTGCVPCASRLRIRTTFSSTAPLPSSCGRVSVKRSADNGAIPTSPTYSRRSMPPPRVTAILDGCALGSLHGRFGIFATSSLFRKGLCDMRLTRSSKCVAICSFGGRLAAPRTGAPSTPSSPTFDRWPSAWRPRFRHHRRNLIRLDSSVAVFVCVLLFLGLVELSSALTLLVPCGVCSCDFECVCVNSVGCLIRAVCFIYKAGRKPFSVKQMIRPSMVEFGDNDA